MSSAVSPDGMLGTTDGVTQAACDDACCMPSAIDLYWLPLGAGGHSVRYNGRAFEWVVSRVEHRTARDLYHSALEVRVRSDRYVIEMTPIPRGDPPGRGAVVTGPVGSGWAGRWRIFRYEVRR